MGFPHVTRPSEGFLHSIASRNLVKHTNPSLPSFLRKQEPSQTHKPKPVVFPAEAGTQSNTQTQACRLSCGSRNPVKHTNPSLPSFLRKQEPSQTHKPKPAVFPAEAGTQSNTQTQACRLSCGSRNPVKHTNPSLPSFLRKQEPSQTHKPKPAVFPAEAGTQSNTQTQACRLSCGSRNPVKHTNPSLPSFLRKQEPSQTHKPKPAVFPAEAGTQSNTQTQACRLSCGSRNPVKHTNPSLPSFLRKQEPSQTHKPKPAVFPAEAGTQSNTQTQACRLSCGSRNPVKHTNPSLPSFLRKQEPSQTHKPKPAVFPAEAGTQSNTQTQACRLSCGSRNPVKHTNPSLPSFLRKQEPSQTHKPKPAVFPAEAGTQSNTQTQACRLSCGSRNPVKHTNPSLPSFLRKQEPSQTHKPKPAVFPAEAGTQSNTQTQACRLSCGSRNPVKHTNPSLPSFLRKQEPSQTHKPKPAVFPAEAGTQSNTQTQACRLSCGSRNPVKHTNPSLPSFLRKQEPSQTHKPKPAVFPAEAGTQSNTQTQACRLSCGSRNPVKHTNPSLPSFLRKQEPSQTHKPKPAVFPAEAGTQSNTQTQACRLSCGSRNPVKHTNPSLPSFLRKQEPSQTHKPKPAVFPAEAGTQSNTQTQACRLSCGSRNPVKHTNPSLPSFLRKQEPSQTHKPKPAVFPAEAGTQSNTQTQACRLSCGSRNPVKHTNPSLPSFLRKQEPSQTHKPKPAVFPAEAGTQSNTQTQACRLSCGSRNPVKHTNPSLPSFLRKQEPSQTHKPKPAVFPAEAGTQSNTQTQACRLSCGSRNPVKHTNPSLPSFLRKQEPSQTHKPKPAVFPAEAGTQSNTQTRQGFPQVTRPRGFLHSIVPAIP